MNKKILSLIISFIVVVLYYYFRGQQHIKISSNQIPTQQVVKDKINTPQDLIPTPLSSNKRATEFSTSHQGQSKQEAKVKSLIQCLNKNNCGMKPEKDDPYFDQAEVRGSKELKKILKKLLQDPTVTAHLDYESLYKLPNEEIKLSAAALFLRSANDMNIMVEKLIAAEHNFTGSSKALLFKLLFQNELSTEVRVELLNKLNKNLQDSDTYMVMRILEESKSYQLTEQEFKEIIVASCRIKYSPDDKHNWKMIRYALNEAIKQNSYHLNVETLCP